MNISIKRAVWLCLASAGCGATAIAAAADTVAAEGNLAEIVVTAQHREQKESDVGISMTVVTNEQLGALGVTNSRDISNFTPGIFLSGAVGGQSTQYTIRGVGQSDFNDAIESPNATYIDDVYAPVAQAASLGLFDVDRLEVLKGPQGTLFGRNATGGAILTVIAQPKLGTTDGYANVSYGRFNDTKVEAAFNAPVSSNAAIRISGFYHYRDNFWDNLYPAGIAPGAQYNNYGAPSGVNYETWGPQGLDSGGVHEWGVRGQLLFRPTDQLNARLSVNAAGTRMPGPAQTEVPSTPVFNAAGQVIDEIPTAPGDSRTGIGPGGVNVNPGGFIGFSPSAGGTRPVPGGTWWGMPVGAQDLNFSQTFLAPSNTSQSATATLHLDYQMSGATLTSITAYQHYSKSLMNNVTGDPVNSLYYGTLAHYNVFSEELRLAGKTDQLVWQAGVYYLHNNAWNTQDIKGEPGSLWALIFGASATGLDADETANLKTDSISIFGQTDWKFAPEWTLVAGARVVSEHQDYDYRQFMAANDCGAYSICYTTPLAGYDGLASSFVNKRTQTLWAGKLQLEFRPANDLMIYAGVNRGVKAGSYNSKLLDGSGPYPADKIPYKAETLYNFESGIKYADSRITAEVAAFYYLYQDFQGFLFTNLNGIVSNVPARMYGVDFNLGWNVARDLRLTVGGVVLKAWLPDYTVVDALNGAPAIVKDVRPAYVPNDTLSGGFTYTAPAEVAGGTIKLMGQVSYASDFYINAKNYTSALSPSRTLVNLNLGWRSNKTGLSVAAYAKNLLDKRYSTISYDNSGLNGAFEDSIGDPRTYGVMIGYKF